MSSQIVIWVEQHLVAAEMALADEFVEQERGRILAWLSPLDFRAKYHDVLSRRHPGTSQWILDSPEFMSWRNRKSEVLWCTGIPGAGKTVLASIIIERLEKDLMTDENMALAYLYCSYQDPEHTFRNLIASILRQLLQPQATVPQRIERFYKSHLMENTQPTLEQLMVELQIVLSESTDVFVVLDALDECCEDMGSRYSFMEAFQWLADHVHLLITTRATTNLCNLTTTAIHLKVDAKDGDIVKYVEGRMISERRLQRNVAGYSDLQATIIGTVLRSAKGMFLLARLHMDSLAKKHNRRDIRVALDSLPKELYGTYGEALERIMSQDGEDVELAK